MVENSPDIVKSKRTWMNKWMTSIESISLSVMEAVIPEAPKTDESF